MAKKQLVTTAEASELIGISQRMVVKYIGEGKMESEKIDGRHMIAKSELRRFQSARTKAIREAEKAKKAKEKESAKKNVPAKKNVAQKPTKKVRKGGKK